MDISEKVAYLKGLSEGLGVDKSSKEGKLMDAVIDVLTEVADNLLGLEAGVDTIANQIDFIAEDIDEIYESLEGDYEGGHEYNDHHSHSKHQDHECCGKHDHGANHHNHECSCGEDYDLDGEVYEVVCPKCGEEVYIDEEILDEGSMPCPNCSENLEFDFEGMLEAD